MKKKKAIEINLIILENAKEPKTKYWRAYHHGQIDALNWVLKDKEQAGIVQVRLEKVKNKKNEVTTPASSQQ